MRLVYFFQFLNLSHLKKLNGVRQKWKNSQTRHVYILFLFLFFIFLFFDFYYIKINIFHKK